MSLENTLKENCDIKGEPMDPENKSGQDDADLENTALDLTKDEYINEDFSNVKIEEHAIEEEDFNLKKDKDIRHISDSGEHLRDNHVKDQETLNTYTSADIRKSIYSCNKCSKNFDQNSQLVRHLKTHIGEKKYSCNQCGKNFSHRSTLIRHMINHTGVKNIHVISAVRVSAKVVV